jgi:hypothetical protein
MPQHDNVAQVVLHTALEKIGEDTGRWNKRMATPRRKQRGNASPPKIPHTKKNGSVLSD